jgi:hypothetical protein
MLYAVFGVIERFHLQSLGAFCRMNRTEQEYAIAYHLLRCKEDSMNGADSAV